MPTVQLTYTQLFALRLALDELRDLRTALGVVAPDWPRSKEPLSASAAASADMQCDDPFWMGHGCGTGASL